MASICSWGRCRGLHSLRGWGGGGRLHAGRTVLLAEVSRRKPTYEYFKPMVFPLHAVGKVLADGLMMMLLIRVMISHFLLANN